jgi:hypothetical protein
MVIEIDCICTMETEYGRIENKWIGNVGKMTIERYNFIQALRLRSKAEI